jgi:hypothetical protein
MEAKEHMEFVVKELKALSEKVGLAADCNEMKLELERQKLELDVERELKRMKTTECNELKAKLTGYRERQDQKIDAAVKAREKALAKQHYERESDLINKLGSMECRVLDVKVSYDISERERNGLKRAVSELKRKLAAARAGLLEEAEASDEKLSSDEDDNEEDRALYAAAMDKAAGDALMDVVMAKLRKSSGLVVSPDAVVRAVRSWDKGTLLQCVADAVPRDE